MNAPIDWLLAGEPWLAYRVRLDLLGEAENSPPVCNARQALLAEPRLQSLLAELNEWPWTVISSHKSAGQPFHKLTFVGQEKPIHDVVDESVPSVQLGDGGMGERSD